MTTNAFPTVTRMIRLAMNLFSLLLLLCFLPIADVGVRLQGAEEGGSVVAVSTIEPALRAIQERYEIVYNKSLTWPSREGLPADKYPPNGFYSGISQADMNALVRTAIVAIKDVVGMYRSGYHVSSEVLTLPDLEGKSLDNGFAIALAELRMCRFLHYGPGGLKPTIRWSEMRRIDISRNSLYPPVDVEWFNSHLARGGPRIYDRPVYLATDDVYALSLRTVHEEQVSMTGWETIGTGFEYGFSVGYDLSKWDGLEAKPFYSLVWYSGNVDAVANSPQWPAIDGHPLLNPPFWMPAGTVVSDLEPLLPWVTLPHLGFQKADVPVRRSCVFEAPARVTCGERTVISCNMQFDTASLGERSWEKLWPTCFYQLDYHGFMVDVSTRFKHDIPATGSIEVAHVYPEGCPFCPMVVDTAHSVIDNGSLTYYHDAWDYRIGAVAGCGTCGGSSADVGSLGVALGRIHRYRDLDWGASFGPGVLSNHDLRLMLYVDGTGGLAGRFFDPLKRVPCELTGMPGSSSLVDQGTVARSLTLLDSAGGATAALTSVRKAQLELRDDRVVEFEIFPLQGGAGGYAGRVLTVSDPQGHRVTYQYVDGDANVVASAADADVSALWRFSSVQDQTGARGTFTWTAMAGQWVIQTATMPGGGIFAYQYAEGGLVSLSKVVYPTGETTTITPGWDDGQQLVTLAISDAGAETTHRRKTVYVTPSIEKSVTGGWTTQLPNLVRRVENGSGEISYRNWVEVNGDYQDYYNLTGGGQDGMGVLRWVRYQAGLPILARVAARFFPDQPLASHEWLTESAYTTDAQMRPTTLGDPMGAYTTYERDARGNITARIRHRPDGSEISREVTTYDERYNPLTVTDALGRVTRNDYNPAGLLAKRTVAVGTPDEASWNYSYDQQGRLLAATDANGNTTDYAYDPVTGLVASIAEPADIPGGDRPVRRFTYDAAGRLKSSADAAGRLVSYAYDGRGRPTVTTYADGTTEETVYGTGGDANLVVKRKDRAGIWEESAYDGSGRLTGSIRNRGQGDQVVRSVTYLPGKDLVAAETVNGRTTAYHYDAHGRVARVTSLATTEEAQVSQSAHWDAVGVTVSTDAQGRSTYSLVSVDGLRSRTVREMRPQAVQLSGDMVEQAAALWALARPAGLNPGYIIEESLSDAAGQVVARTDAGGVASSSSYDQQGRVTAEVVSDSRSGQTIKTGYVYDPQGNRTRVLSPRSFGSAGEGTFATDTSYTGRNLPASVTQWFAPAGGSTMAAIVATTTYTYTVTGKKATESDPRNPAWITAYGYGACCDRVETVTDPLGFLTRYQYDAAGRMAGTVDANGVVTSSLADAQGRVVSRTDGVGAVTTTVFDEDLTDGVGIDQLYPTAVVGLGFGPGAAGSAEMTSSPAGIRQVVIRDGLGREVRRLVDDGNRQDVTSIAYGPVGADGLESTTVTDPAGRTTTTYRSGSGQVMLVRQANGATAGAIYDAAGRMVAQTDANGVTTSIAYDDLGRVVAQTNGAGGEVRQSYDEQGNLTRTQDAMGQVERRVYDGLNRCIQVTDRTGATTRFIYTLTGSLERIIDAEGRETVYAYSPRNELLSETYADGGSKSSTYDPGGRQKTRTDQRGITTTFAYDGAGRVLERSYSTGNKDVFTYDLAGRMLTANSGRYGTRIERVYQNGRLVSEIQSQGQARATIGIDYDHLNRPVFVGLDDGTAQTVSYAVQGQVERVALDGSTVVERSFDAGGRLSQSRLANTLQEDRGYTAANRLAGLTVAASATASKVVDLALAYDPNQRKMKEHDRTAAGEQQTFAYDHGDRLTGWSRDPGAIGQAPPVLDEQTWSLSAVGDWIQTVVNGSTQSRTHGVDHATTTIAGVPLAYDAAGNLTRDQHGRQYIWDEENRLVAVTVQDAEGVQDTAVMVYDALGRRLARSAFGTTTTFVQNGSQVLQERDAPVVQPPASIASDSVFDPEATPPPGSVLQMVGGRYVNHQPADTAIPSGWIADKGRALDERTNGLTYGWVDGAQAPAALGADASVIRRVMPQPELDTLHLPPASDAGAWRMALPNGTYAVVVIAGDAASTRHTNHLLLNGVRLTDPDPFDEATPPGYNQGDFDGWAMDVTVADGYLTLGAAADGLDPALCLVEIGPEGSHVDQAVRDRLSDRIVSASNRTAKPAFRRPPSPRTFVYAGDYIDAPVAVRVGAGAGARTYYSHTNGQYSPLVLTDQNGEVAERYSYTAYGERSIVGGNGSLSGLGFQFGFTGLRDEDGLLFARNRYFSPEMGRWISRDPAGYVDGYLLYNGYFVPNANDPEGKFIWGMVAAGVISAGFDAAYQYYTNPGHEIDWVRVGMSGMLGATVFGGIAKIGSAMNGVMGISGAMWQAYAIATVGAVGGGIMGNSLRENLTSDHPNYYLAILDAAGAVGLASGMARGSIRYGQEVFNRFVAGDRSGLVVGVPAGAPMLPLRNTVLPISHQGQKPTCIAFSTGMVLDTIVPQRVSTVVGRLFGTATRITYIDEAVSALNGNGIPAVFRSGMTLADLSQYTSRGAPAIVAIRTPAGNHAVVIDGITERAGLRVVAIRDPHGRAYFMEESEFLGKWVLNQGVVIP